MNVSNSSDENTGRTRLFKIPYFSVRLSGLSGSYTLTTESSLEMSTKST